MKQYIYKVLFCWVSLGIGYVVGRYVGVKQGHEIAAHLIRENTRDLGDLALAFEHTISHGIIIKPERLDTLKSGKAYEFTPDSSKRRYWLLVEPDTTEFSNLK